MHCIGQTLPGKLRQPFRWCILAEREPLRFQFLMNADDRQEVLAALPLLLIQRLVSTATLPLQTIHLPKERHLVEQHNCGMARPMPLD